MNFNFKQGQRYRVRYKIIGLHRVTHEFVGTYIGDVERLKQREAQFSLRPASGTSQLRYEYILSAEPVGTGVPHSNPRRSE